MLNAKKKPISFKVKSTMNTELDLLDVAKQHFIENANLQIHSINYQGECVWIKRRPFSKKAIWHKLQKVATYFLPAIFAPTVSEGGAESLKQEAARIRLLASHDIAVPRVLVETEEFFITSDVGKQLHHYLHQLSDPEQKQHLLQQAVQALNRLHQANLCHGRPSLRDMTVKENTIFFIDLEENPLAVMSLAQAQARDCWLFFNSVANHCTDITLLTNLFHVYQQGIATETMLALKKMVFTLKPARIFLEFFFGKVIGRDGRCAIKANKALETIFA
jgi:tRNA A-37 threonylcarbamoyl transferase component Bud32